VAAVAAFAAAFLVVGIAAGGESSPEPARKAAQVRLSQSAELPALAEDPALAARRRERARAARRARVERLSRTG